MLQPLDSLQDLRAHCVPSWGSRQLVVVTLKAIGWPDKRIAVTLATTERSVRRNIDAAKTRIAEGTRIEPDRDALVAWWWCHTSCCMAGALRALESGKLLESA